MKKNILKYVIDVTLFVNICTIAVIGFLMAFIIPAGKVPAGKYFLGLHRHQWGNIHLYLSVLLLFLLVFHLWLNWTWILQSTKRYFGGHWRHALLGISFAWAGVLFLAWIFIKL